MVVLLGLLTESIIEEMIKERIKRDFGDRVKLTMTLQARGITYESYRQQIRERFIVDAMRRRNIASWKRPRRNRWRTCPGGRSSTTRRCRR